MKQAFLIMAHNDFKQLEYLLKSLDSYNNDIYVHIDSRAKNVPLLKLESAVKKSTLEIIRKFKVNWGGHSQINCELLLFKTAFERDTKYRYYHLMSGADFLIKSIDKVYDFFDISYPKNFIEFAKYKKENFSDVTELIAKISYEPDTNFLNRISTYHLLHDFSIFNRSRIILFIDRIFSKIQTIAGINRLSNHEDTICKGSNWGSFTDEFVEYLLSKEIQDYINSFIRSGLCADEIYKQTIIYNSIFNNTIYIDKEMKNSNLRKIDWQRGDPYIFQAEDYEELINDSINFFARKFNYEKNPELTKKLFINIGNSVEGKN